MRRIYLFFMVFFIFSCKKDDNPTMYENPPSPPCPPADVYIYEPCDTTNGVARASKLGNPWIGGVRMVSSKNSGVVSWAMYITTCVSGNLTREIITLGGFPEDDPLRFFPVIYNLQIDDRDFVGAFYSNWGDDGDVLLDHYRFDTTATIPSYLHITKWDTVARIAEGKFQVAFRATQIPTSDPKHPEFMVFSDGRFWARMLD